MSSLLLMGAGNKGGAASGGAVNNRQAMVGGAQMPVFVVMTVSTQSVAAGPVAVNQG